MKSKILLPQIEINRVLPSNQSAKQSYIGKTSEVRLIDYGKAYIDSKGMIFRGLKIMRDSYPSWHPYPNFYQRQKWLKNLYMKSKTIDAKTRPLLTVVDGETTCYYHWMWDSLIRINLVKKELNNDFLLVLPKKLFDNNFCLRSLEMIGIHKDQIVVLDKRDSVKSNRVLFPTWILGGGKDGTNYDSEIIKTKNDLLDYCKSKNQLSFSLGDKIFISRGRQKKRKILNQRNVEQLLQKYGFTIVCMEDLSFEEGISVSYNSKYTIAQCASGLTNIIFQKPGSKVLELYPKESYDYDHAWFSELSQAGNLIHSYQYCEIDSSNIFVNEFHTDMIVDLPTLEKNIHAMLSNS